MKKIILLTFLVIFTLCASTAFAGRKDVKPAVPDKTENKLSEEELSRLTKRVEEIRDMDKTNLTGKVKRDLRKEVKGIKENVKKDGQYIYIGTATIILIIILVLLLA
jgi:hypothetical protein